MTTLRDALARAYYEYPDLATPDELADAAGHAGQMAERLRSDPEVLTAFAEALDWLDVSEADKTAQRLLDRLLGAA